MKVETVVAALKKGLDVVNEERQDDKTLLFIEDGIQVEVFPDGNTVQVDVMHFVAGVNSDETNGLNDMVAEVADIVRPLTSKATRRLPKTAGINGATAPLPAPKEGR